MFRNGILASFLYVTVISMHAGCASFSSVPVTPETLKNAEFKSEWLVLGKAKLTHGLYKEKFAPGSSTEIILRLSDKMAISDLNGDRQDDAAVILITDPGGSGILYELALVLNQNGKLVHADSVPLGDRIKVKEVTVESGRVRLQMIVHGPKDPMCCPSLEVTRYFKMRGDRLVQIH